MTILDTLHTAYLLIRLNRSQWWSRTRIRKYQRDAVIEILRHAVNTVPYYKSLGLRADTILSINDIEKFPVLTKHGVQDLGDELLADGYSRAKLQHSMTSGTSGEPTTTYFDKTCWLYSKYALKIRRMMGSGLGLFRRIVVVSEQSLQQLQMTKRLAGSRFLFEQRYLSIQEPIGEHIKFLLESRIDALYAFPSYLNELINYCEVRNISLPVIPVIFTSSEVLQDALRSRIETRLGARVCDIYGCTEFKEIAWQCANGTYHLNFESVYIEIVSNDDPDHAGSGDVLVTSLINRAMPLIRYKIGDECKLEFASCGCGRDSLSLSRINGRVVDMVRLPGDKRISPYLLTTAIESHSEIAKYQIVQSTLDELEVRYVFKNCDLSAADVRSIQSALRKHLGEAMHIHLRAVPEICRTVAGKHRVFVQAMES
jgi:phenylacetate-CoA ligase